MRSIGTFPRLRPHARLHLLDITKYFGPTSGGIRTYLMEKAAWIERHPEVRHTLIVPAESDGVAETEGVRCYRIGSPRIPFQSQYRALVAPQTIRRIIAHERPHLIEVGSPLLVPWIVRWANRSFRIPTAWFLHGNLIRLVAPRSFDSPPGHRWRYALARRYVARVSQCFDRVVVSSDVTHRELAGISTPPVLRTTLGVDLDAFRPADQAQNAESRRALGWPDGPVVLYLGRMAREKRIDVVARAWAAIGAEMGATLVLMGDGPDRDRLRRLARTDRVVWRPHDPDRRVVARALAAADLYLAPGPAETFGLSALEAMACGTAVVSVDQGAVPELLARSATGATYRHGDSEDVVRVLREALHWDFAAVGQQARAYAERWHRWDDAFGAQFESYRSMVRQP